jgi:hypothetical protein
LVNDVQSHVTSPHQPEEEADRWSKISDCCRKKLRGQSKNLDHRGEKRYRGTPNPAPLNKFCSSPQLFPAREQLSLVASTFFAAF